MNSLEYIEKEIEYIEEKIIYLKKKYIENKNFPYEDRFLAMWIKCCQEELQALQQIKNELEAWYSIKQGIELCEGKIGEDSYYECLLFEDRLFDESASEKAGEILKPIKKALEIDNG